MNVMTLDELSPSSRRAWIEIMSVQFFYLARLVALLAEGVDRNRNSCTSRLLTVVALLAEGVDRNI